MTVCKEVEFDKDEIATISKFVEMVWELSTRTGISESSIVSYFLDCSNDEINVSRHDLEMIESY